DRAQQLRNLATAKGTSLSGAVGALMKLLYEHTETEHNIPSVEVNVLADGLAIRFPNSPTTGFSFDAAAKIADAVREYLDGQHAGEKNAHLTDPDTHANSFAIWRRGNSIKIAIPMNAPEKNFTHDLAEEFADLLDNAVARSTVAH
ncbi:MAG: hypothetical protein RLQ73_28275, partial [Hoeflea sp. D1-CHI-28]